MKSLANQFQLDFTVHSVENNQESQNQSMKQPRRLESSNQTTKKAKLDESNDNES